MTALTDHSNPADGADDSAESVERLHLRQRLHHQRAKRLDRRDPSRSLTKKRVRHEILSRP
jgi:hypothetical protein